MQPVSCVAPLWGRSPAWARAGGPDYLPLVLEFLSAAPDWARLVLLDGFGKELIGIYAALEARHPDSAYVSLFRPVVAVLGLVPEQRLPAKRLEEA